MESLPLPRSCKPSQSRIFEIISEYLHIQGLGQVCTALLYCYMKSALTLLNLQLAVRNLPQEHQCFALIYSTSLSFMGHRPMA